LICASSSALDVRYQSRGSVREIISDVECLSDFLGRLALDHVCDSLAASVEKGLDIQIISSLHVSIKLTTETKIGGSYKDNFKQHFLVDLHEFLIPIIDIRRLFIALVVLLVLYGIIFMVISPFKNLQRISFARLTLE
jgi:hypothetical protein